MNRDEEERRYAELMGADALQRQANKPLCKICYWPNDAHNPECPKYRRQAQEAQNPRRKRR